MRCKREQEKKREKCHSCGGWYAINGLKIHERYCRTPMEQTEVQKTLSMSTKNTTWKDSDNSQTEVDSLHLQCTTYAQDSPQYSLKDAHVLVIAPTTFDEITIETKAHHEESWLNGHMPKVKDENETCGSEVHRHWYNNTETKNKATSMIKTESHTEIKTEPCELCKEENQDRKDIPESDLHSGNILVIKPEIEPDISQSFWTGDVPVLHGTDITPAYVTEKIPEAIHETNTNVPHLSNSDNVLVIKPEYENEIPEICLDVSFSGVKY